MVLNKKRQLENDSPLSIYISKDKYHNFFDRTLTLFTSVNFTYF